MVCIHQEGRQEMQTERQSYFDDNFNVVVDGKIMVARDGSQRSPRGKQITPMDPTVKGIVDRINYAKTMLEEAKTDCERLLVRDTAAAAQAAAEILGLKEVVKSAAWIVQRAEREIAKANPPATGGRGKTVNSELTVSRQTLSNIRRTHSHISDEEFDRREQENITDPDAEPPTRSALLRESSEQRTERTRQTSIVGSNAKQNFSLHVSGIDGLQHHIPEGGVDAIVTEPPSGRENLELWTYLVRFASYQLRPGGHLIAISERAHHPRIIGKLQLSRLVYRWMISYAPQGASPTCPWRAVLIYRRAGAPTVDVIGPASEMVSTLDDLIQAWTPEGALICDPFCGDGETLMAAYRSGRDVIGADIDEDRVRKAGERLREL